MYKICSETLDMILLIFLLLGGWMLFSDYWKEETRLDYAEYITESFFDMAERKQSVSYEEYEAWRKEILTISASYEISFRLYRKDDIWLQSQWETILWKEGILPLEAGDFFMVCLSEAAVKKVILYRMIRW